MVAPPFVPECITPKCLKHGNEGEATPTTTVGILRPLIYIYIYMVELSLTDSSLTFATVGDGRYSSFP